jgi:REP element-mobilizing transposase RayT
VLVTIPLKRGLPRLRKTRERKVLERAFHAGRERSGFRLTQYSIQSDHLHLLVEADDRRALSRGMQGLLVRIARALNKLWTRTGKVFRDRYHDRILRTPREVRNALRYVLNNARKHGLRTLRQTVDGFTSAPWFDGWRGQNMEPLERGPDCPVMRARTWLQRTGWRRHGLLDADEVPGTQ